jgi:tetratricopeptide (TPR) repeat protein
MLEKIHARGCQLSEAGRHQEALELWDRTVGIFPDHPVALFGVASSLAQLGLPGSAVSVLKYSVTQHPIPDSWYQMAQCLRQIQDTDNARQCYDEALKLNPDDRLKRHIYTGYAGSYVNMGNPEEGLKWADKALALKPDFGHAINAKALLLLEAERYNEGWPLYAERWKLPGYLVRNYDTIKQWQFSLTVQDTLIIHAEQGLGDEILFASLIPEMMKYAPGKVLGECQGRLIELFRRSFPEIKWFATPDELRASKEYAELDQANSAWFRMGDLPGILPPQKKPFLKADPVKVAGYKARLNALGPGPYVGFSWKGGSAETHERVRNAPKDRWRDLLQKCPGTPISIQYGPGEKLGLPHWECAIADLDEFAALISALDLVVSCCGASVHFAGGLGIPCWAAVPKECAWRYAGDEMRWYKSVKMHKGSWDKVFYSLGYDLENYGTA